MSARMSAHSTKLPLLLWSRTVLKRMRSMGTQVLQSSCGQTCHAQCSAAPRGTRATAVRAVTSKLSSTPAACAEQRCSPPLGMDVWLGLVLVQAGQHFLNPCIYPGYHPHKQVTQVPPMAHDSSSLHKQQHDLTQVPCICKQLNNNSSPRSHTWHLLAHLECQACAPAVLIHKVKDPVERKCT